MLGGMSGSPEVTEAASAAYGRKILRVAAGVAACCAIGWSLVLVKAFWEEEARRSERSGSSGRVVRQAPSFDMSGALVPVQGILSGGPPKDGIPALTDPVFLPASDADYLSDDDRVIGVSINGAARAYPLRILNYHEIVNDRIGEAVIAVTYCPLCDSSVVFEREVEGEEIELGVSGLLYNSNVLMYDRQSDGKESLWSQMAGKAVTGRRSGRALKRLPLVVTTWGAWLHERPETLVLSDETGHLRDYSRSPYGAYFGNDRLIFPVEPIAERLPMKEAVVGVIAGDTSMAFPLSKLETMDQESVTEEVGGCSVIITFKESPSSVVVTSACEEVEWVYSFWFAWAAFHPGTSIYGE